MKQYTLNFGTRREVISGAGSQFTNRFVAAVRLATSRGEPMPPELEGMSISEIRRFAEDIPEEGGGATTYGQVERTVEEVVQASTAVKSKASGARG